MLLLHSVLLVKQSFVTLRPFCRFSGIFYLRETHCCSRVRINVDNSTNHRYVEALHLLMLNFMFYVVTTL